MEFCPSCGRLVSPEAPYCSACGANLRQSSGYSTSSSRQPYSVGAAYTPSKKDPKLATALALILGFFGLWGLGQIYAGSVAKGLGLFVAGLIIGGLFWFSVILTVIYIGYVGMAIFGIFFIGGWLWQALDAYSSAQAYNELHASAPRS
jgi:hypothetical protein